MDECQSISLSVRHFLIVIHGDLQLEIHFLPALLESLFFVVT